MTVVFITGLSGVGKSSVLLEMNTRGYHTVDLDDGYMTVKNKERLINSTKLFHLLNQPKPTSLILAGTESNQGEFYSYFDAVVLLTADLETMLKRVENRTNNSYGKSKVEKDEIIRNYTSVLPLLKKRADLIIDTTSTSNLEVCDQLEELL